MSSFDDDIDNLFSDFKADVSTDTAANAQEQAGQTAFLVEFGKIRETVILPRLLSIKQRQEAARLEGVVVTVDKRDPHCATLSFNDGWRLSFKANAKAKRVEVGRHHLDGKGDNPKSVCLEDLSPSAVEKEVAGFVGETLDVIRANLRSRMGL